MKIAVIGGGSTYTPELVSGLSRERTAQGAALHGPIRWSVAVNRGE